MKLLTASLFLLATSATSMPWQAFAADEQFYYVCSLTFTSGFTHCEEGGGCSDPSTLSGVGKGDTEVLASSAAQQDCLSKGGNLHAGSNQVVQSNFALRRRHMWQPKIAFFPPGEQLNSYEAQTANYRVVDLSPQPLEKETTRCFNLTVQPYDSSIDAIFLYVKNVDAPGEAFCPMGSCTVNGYGPMSSALVSDRTIYYSGTTNSRDIVLRVNNVSTHDTGRMLTLRMALKKDMLPPRISVKSSLCD